MNNVKVKLKAVRVDEYNVRHHCEGTEHLPVGYFAGYCGGYAYYAADGEMIDRGYRKYGHDRRTLKDCREWVAGYDAEFVAAKYAEMVEEAIRENNRVDYNRRRAEAEMVAVRNVPNPKRLVVGGMVDGMFPNMNKNCTLGEYVLEILEGDVSNEVCKVVAVINMTNEEYDVFAVNLMENRADYLEGEKPSEYGGTIGGSESNDPRLDGVDWMTVCNTPALLDIYRATYYTLVHAVEAPNRETVLVNTEGYKYARYCGFVK